MKTKIVVIFIALAFVLSAVAVAFADDKSGKNSKQTTQLVALLPQSDGVSAVDLKRLMNEALPQILSADKAKFDKLMAVVEDVKAKTGLDLMQFDHFAGGVKTTKDAAGKFQFEPVMLARGSYNASALVAIAKLVSKGKYREEKVGSRTIYIFSSKEILDDNKPKAKGNVFDSLIDKMIGSLTNEIAVTSYDQKTVAFGSTARVREMIEGKSRIDGQLLDLVFRSQTAVISFGAIMPKGMSSYLELDNPQIDKNIDAIKQIYGAMDVDQTGTLVKLTAKTNSENSAEELSSFLEGSALVFGGILGAAKGDDKQVYSRMLKNAKITRQGSEVMLDLKVPQSDIDVILGAK